MISSASAIPSISGICASNSTSGKARDCSSAPAPLCLHRQEWVSIPYCAAGRTADAGWWHCRPPPALRCLPASAASRRFLCARLTTPAGKIETAAAPGITVDLQFSSHHRHQPGGDRQPETGAAVFSGRRVIRPAERFENDFLLVFGDADTAVADAEQQTMRIVGHRLNTQHHFASGSKFERVADQVGQYLA